ncbi:unnamed protein product [Clonostachys rhizophaga]|uniref:Heterokaryon incompatibility domain-containing protein n=1 Tax=Clonostachys rhizophaga TaxID=160324 RepID=A0A9N9W1V7_9HYPO|nr:unnamed protein product [Clonostachys rhizophaga]
MPTRVLDVGDSVNRKPISLVHTQRVCDDYIALSYCWGEVGNDILTLTTATYGAMRGGIAESALSKTHQEVISLARTLGIRYVWVDALCIIQGDAEDWERESKTMAQVYGNATLVIIAGRSADSRRGFITNNLASNGRPPPCKLPIDESEHSGSLMIDIPRVSDIGPVSTRGWCFQERLSSRRSVIFGEEQLIFECVTEFALENGLLETNKIRPTFLQPPPPPPLFSYHKNFRHGKTKYFETGTISCTDSFFATCPTPTIYSLPSPPSPSKPRSSSSPGSEEHAPYDPAKGDEAHEGDWNSATSAVVVLGGGRGSRGTGEFFTSLGGEVQRSIKYQSSSWTCESRKVDAG